jgi:hypothetical protein
MLIRHMGTWAFLVEFWQRPPQQKSVMTPTRFY